MAEEPAVEMAGEPYTVSLTLFIFRKFSCGNLRETTTLIWSFCKYLLYMFVSDFKGV